MEPGKAQQQPLAYVATYNKNDHELIRETNFKKREEIKNNKKKKN